MRTHVAKMFVGVGVVGDAGALALGEVAIAPWGAIQALLNTGTVLPVPAASDQFGFVYTNPAGTLLTSGPFSSANALVDQNPYNAGTQQVSTLTVDVTNMVDGKAYIIKVVYHDNLSIIPNQMKFTTVSVVFTSGMTATQFAAAVATQFNNQDQLFVTVTSAVAVVTFTSIQLTSASAYNRIDRPEFVVFELAVGDMTYGSYPTGMFVVAYTTPRVLPQGTAAQIAWMEDNHQGRRGFADRRMWNDSKQFVPVAVAGTTYTTFITTDNKNVEGDMQDLRSNPIGAVIATTAATAAAFLAGFNTIIGTANAVNVIQHPVDS